MEWEKDIFIWTDFATVIHMPHTDTEDDDIPKQRFSKLSLKRDKGDKENQEIKQPQPTGNDQDFNSPAPKVHCSFP